MKIKALLYCTKAKPMLRIAKEELKGQKRARCYSKEETEYFTQYIDEEMYEANGKIVAECDYEVEKLQIIYGKGWETKTIKGTENVEKLTCLSRDKLYQYCKGNGYAIHIKNLHIFDKPKELDYYYSRPKKVNTFDWYRLKGYTYANISLDKAPQNMMYCCSESGKEYILISIQSQWLCKILNKEKTIEVRKVVLKEMLKNE